VSVSGLLRVVGDDRVSDLRGSGELNAMTILNNSLTPVEDLELIIRQDFAVRVVVELHDRVKLLFHKPADHLFQRNAGIDIADPEKVGAAVSDGEDVAGLVDD
jgi:hypothetical protein